MIGRLDDHEQLAADAAAPGLRRIAFASLASEDEALVRAALAATGTAYAPYSGFAVGAAVRGGSGRIHTGANFENASYGLTMCAEVAALTAANTAGERTVTAIAIVGHKFMPPESAAAAVTPCGRCRQLITEYAQAGETAVRVLSCSGDLSEIIEAPIPALLPEAFGPASMGGAATWNGMRPKLAAALAKLQKLAPR